MPTDRSKAIARAIADAIGSRPTIRASEAVHFPAMKVAVLYAPDWPRRDVNIAITVDLGDDPVRHLDRQYEFYIVARPGWDIEQVLGDVGVRVRRGIVVPAPGEFIINGMLPTYPQTRVQHLVALDPPAVPLPFDAPDVIPPVGFLQLVPFTDAERQVLETRGRDALASVLRKRGPDLLDFDRA